MNTHPEHMNTTHEQVTIQVARFGSIQVDEGLADIIAALNRRKMVTDNSCQDLDGLVRIGFLNYLALRRFIEDAFRQHLDSGLSDKHQQTLFGFIRRSCKTHSDFYENCHYDRKTGEITKRTGTLDTADYLTFPKEDLEKFRGLFLQVYSR